jgi:hypothetical protein
MPPHPGPHGIYGSRAFLHGLGEFRDMGIPAQFSKFPKFPNIFKFSRIFQKIINFKISKKFSKNSKFFPNFFQLKNSLRTYKFLPIYLCSDS